MDFDFLDEHDDAATSAAETEAMRRGESPKSDAEAAEILTDKVSSLMISVSTGGPQIKQVDADYTREHRALRAVLRRLHIDYPNNFDDLWRWYGRWSEGDLPQYRDRRTFIAELFAPVRRALADLDAATHDLAEGVADGPTGWPQIDDQMRRLRKLFREADDADAFNGVGLQCMKILTWLGRMVFDPHATCPRARTSPASTMPRHASRSSYSARQERRERPQTRERRVRAGERGQASTQRNARRRWCRRECDGVDRVHAAAARRGRLRWRGRTRDCDVEHHVAVIEMSTTNTEKDDIRTYVEDQLDEAVVHLEKVGSELNALAVSVFLRRLSAPSCWMIRCRASTMSTFSASSTCCGVRSSTGN